MRDPLLEENSLTFASIHSAIELYQYAMGYNFKVMPVEHRMQVLRDYHTALSVEQAELLNEVSWKPWRSIESQKPNPDMDKVALEWIDCFIFLIDQALCLGLSSEAIEKAFEAKLNTLQVRIDNGYSKVNTQT